MGLVVQIQTITQLSQQAFFKTAQRRFLSGSRGQFGQQARIGFEQLRAGIAAWQQPHQQFISVKTAQHARCRQRPLRLMLLSADQGNQLAGATPGQQYRHEGLQQTAQP